MKVSDVKDVRKQLGITQAELAQHSNVSQSLIAKMESGLIDPAYSKAVKVFDTLDILAQKKEEKAYQIMQKKIVSVKPTSDVKDAVLQMKKHEISQLPVVDNGVAVGMISEKIILKALLDGNEGDVGSLMVEAPPIVARDTKKTVVSNLLKYFPIVLVSHSGKLVGLITASDIIRRM